MAGQMRARAELQALLAGSGAVAQKGAPFSGKGNRN